MAFPVGVTLPFDQLEHPAEFLSGAAVREISRAAEEAGFSAVSLTDREAPSNRWLENGGHQAEDPFVLLALVAAATKKILPKTGILVLRYRNPFVTARAVSTLDVFSRAECK